jgi:hypothetical protein
MIVLRGHVRQKVFFLVQNPSRMQINWIADREEIFSSEDYPANPLSLERIRASFIITIVPAKIH